MHVLYALPSVVYPLILYGIVPCLELLELSIDVVLEGLDVML
jgi:hypothetical protein